jgi:sterol desaturase/sphingolipid hydroxylase (fatty acid hydroxylase superfamily)
MTFDFETLFFVVMVVSIIVVYLLEALMPLERRQTDIVHSVRNLALWCVAFLLADIVVAIGWLDLQSVLSQQPFGLFYWLPLPQEWMLLVVGLVLIDLSDYLFHRLAHAVPWLWRLHAVHHSDPQIDVSTSIRTHPLELVVSNFWKIGCCLALGVPLWLIGLRELLLWPMIFLQHANVRLPPVLERGLGTVLVVPRVHRHHHSIIRREHDSNYGEGLILWDKWFGSYQQPNRSRPPEYGVSGMQGDSYQTLPGMLLSPFKRLALARRPVAD